MLISIDGIQPFVSPDVFIAPNAVVIGHVTLEAKASVWFQAVLRGDLEPIRIGESTNIQDGAVLHTDVGFPCELGKRVTVGHHAVVHGARVGDGALIGMGAVVLSGAVIGREALVGAGALVPEGMEIPPGHLALGVPAKVIRELTPEEKKRIAAGADSYVEQARRYLANGIGRPVIQGE